MFLLNDKMIQHYRDQNWLDIEDFVPELIHPTYYYFRLGSPCKVWDEQQKEYHLVEISEAGAEVLTIPTRGYVLIQSFERFSISTKVLAMFGQMSAIARMGLRLNHSPTIDPGFRGYLEMGLQNLLDHPRDLKFGDPVGKVLFFDISDTYPISSIKGTISEENYHRREVLKEPKQL